MNIGECAQYGVQQSRQNARCGLIKGVPELGFRLPFGVRDCRKGDDDRAIGQIGAVRQIGNAVQQAGLCGVEQHLFGVRMQFARTKPACDYGGAVQSGAALVEKVCQARCAAYPHPRPIWCPNRQRLCVMRCYQGRYCVIHRGLPLKL